MLQTADHVHSSIRDLSDESWRAVLPVLLDDFQQLLRDAMDLLRELGDAEDHRDRSYWDMPSISPHWQNRGFRDWVTLIELLRDAWLATLASDPERARRIALGWFEIRYRPAIGPVCSESRRWHRFRSWVEWLVQDDAWWLWSLDTQRETLRLLVLQGEKLSPSSRASLEAAILAGPPRHMFKQTSNPRIGDRWWIIWFGCVSPSYAKVGGQLGDDASRCVDDLAAEPRRRLASNERDEFSRWMSGTGDPDYDFNRQVNIAPRKRAELVQWLRQVQPEAQSFYYEDTWLETSRTRFFHSLLALWTWRKKRSGLRNAGETPCKRGARRIEFLRSWRYAAPLVKNMPDVVMQATAHSLTWWMEAASKVIDLQARAGVAPRAKHRNS